MQSNISIWLGIVNLLKGNDNEGYELFEKAINNFRIFKTDNTNF